MTFLFVVYEPIDQLKNPDRLCSLAIALTVTSNGWMIGLLFLVMVLGGCGCGDGDGGVHVMSMV